MSNDKIKVEIDARPVREQVKRLSGALRGLNNAGRARVSTLSYSHAMESIGRCAEIYATLLAQHYEEQRAQLATNFGVHICGKFNPVIKPDIVSRRTRAGPRMIRIGGKHGKKNKI